MKRHTKFFRVNSIGFLTGAVILLFSFGCSSDAGTPPNNSGNDTNDHGNTIATATPVTSGTAVTGKINPDTDEDYFSIIVSGAGTLRASTTGSTDTIGHLYDSDGMELATDDNTGTGNNFDFSHSITAAGTYYVRVTSEGSGTGSYILTVTFATDHGDTRATATSITSGVAVTGSIDPATDRDYFSIIVSGSGTLRASTTGSTDTIGHLYDSDGMELATDDNTGTDGNFDFSHNITAAGTYYIRVTGSTTGAYSLSVAFDKHGDTRATATPVTSGTAVTGEINPDTDEDYFSIIVSRTGILRASTTGSTDTIGHLYDSDGMELATDDNTGTDGNFNFSHSITAAGTYYVRVTSSSTGSYSLTVTFATDHGDTRATATSITSGVAVAGSINPTTDEDYFSIVVPSAGTIRAITTGGTDTIGHLYDSNGTQLATDDNTGIHGNFEFSHSITAAGTYYVRVTSSRTGSYSLTVTFVTDHGDTRATATSITSGVAVAGSINPATDEDYFSIAVSGSTKIIASTTGGLNTIGHLYDSDGTQLATDDNSGTGNNFDFSHNITAAGTYYVRVTSSSTGSYILTVTLVPDKHGDDIATATPVTSGTAVTGEMNPDIDEDYFSITVSGAGTIRAITTGGIVDTFGHLYDSDGDRLAFNDDSSDVDLNFDLSHSVTAAGTYYIRMENVGAALGMYSLTVTFTSGGSG